MELPHKRLHALVPDGEPTAGFSRGLSDAGLDKNYCRNPDGGQWIWCYTTDADMRWDYCDPINPAYDHIERCRGGPKCSGYEGLQTKTVSGRTCQAWSSSTPHAVDASNQANENNYCRNKDSQRDTIWCHTTDPNRPWEYCIPLQELTAISNITNTATAIAWIDNQ